MTTTMITATTLDTEPRTDTVACSPAPRPVVAVVLECREHTLLLKRSQQVTHDRGKWHCVTGYVEDNRPPLQQALDELHEETALRLIDLTALDEGPVLLLPDGQGRDWPVHTYRARTHQRRLALNWEHTAYRWVRPGRLKRFDGRVSWLDDVIAACSTSLGPHGAAQSLHSTDEWARLPDSSVA